MKINSEFDLNISINFYEKYLDSCICAIFELSEEPNFNDDNIKKRIKQLKEDYTKINNNLDEENKFDYIELTNLFDIDDYESRPDINNHFSYYKSSVNSIILSDNYTFWNHDWVFAISGPDVFCLGRFSGSCPYRL